MGAQWKHKGKQANASARGAAYSKMTKAIIMAAKGGADVATNAKLRIAVDAAKKGSLPRENIERAIKKGAGLLDFVHSKNRLKYPEVREPGTKEWKRISVELEALGLISRIDRAALSLYCQAWGHLVILEQSLNARMAAVAESCAAQGMAPDMASAFYFVTAKGYQAQTVTVQMINTLRQQVHTYLKAFGMDPSSRSRVTPSNGGQLGLPGIDAAPGWGQFSQS